jgi:hypothetical protein
MSTYPGAWAGDIIGQAVEVESGVTARMLHDMLAMGLLILLTCQRARLILRKFPTTASRPSSSGGFEGLRPQIRRSQTHFRHP